MTVAVVGGVKSLEYNYKMILKQNSNRFKLFNKMTPDFDKRIKNVDSVIMFTSTISHKMATNCRKLCRRKNILLVACHSSSINGLKVALKEICNNDCENCKYNK